LTIDRDRSVSGLLALHGGGEYVAADEACMDALIAMAVEAAAADGPGVTPRIVVVPTAAARQRPEAAAAHGERGFGAAARRARIGVEIGVAGILSAADAADPRLADTLARAHLVHLPGGDPDLIPAVLGDSPAWAAMRRAYDGSAIIAGASAGAMALAGTCWTPRGTVDGLGLLPGYAVLPHDGPGRLERWRGSLPGVAWLAIGEQTLVVGRPGQPWRVAGRGRVRVIAPDGTERASAGAGETIEL
jgi:cyanophycinase-like exopeptidase